MTTAVIVDAAFREQPAMVLLPVAGVAFCAAGLGFLRFGWWISRRDVDFLSAVIVRALSAGRLTMHEADAADSLHIPLQLTLGR